ncbi:uncharacterized protein LOC129608304 isoform X1 [Condylostylus longicornis]|uniref:uncharacterized protein LOC129608304 isoform X1 n=1 Tax=Condylostylus longicornis TaxID=2530218 RepID=UPI00244DA87F|nr:uncharacterized protein LOC129608304 isoform X1 [Condylostylus longicornis]XP_055375707.1 uncharacterized protein LOC129608304 isoform X1 [Condylostylus longicornis]XP_055375708.1 uncharacterized protein LOC129608304 isoform X1 [Condylostylus longicornis]XP_055375709.1 uncharacterized protein LOC129608304 isoform X1 [Condylostylus longicornis]
MFNNDDLYLDNLSMEQRRKVLRQPRAEPQGQENLQENGTTKLKNENHHVNRPTGKQRSNDHAKQYASRSLSEARNPVLIQSSPTGTANRNSLKKINSNRSLMDISPTSYNTLIIHNDDSLNTLSGRVDLQSNAAQKERPRPYGEPGLQEITEIPDDYLKQSHVLKHLAKEIKAPSTIKNSKYNTTTRDNMVTGKLEINIGRNLIDWQHHHHHLQYHSHQYQLSNLQKLKRSRSYPEMTKLSWNAEIENLSKENIELKEQLFQCRMKVAKTQKLEEEVSNIYEAYNDLVISCERREKLENMARIKLQDNLEKVNAMNRALKDQVDVLKTQLLAPAENQILIAQLFSQNKELLAAKERQDIELAAQAATLQEQRTHIGILDTALNNAQRNIRRLEDEMRKKQMHIERLIQIQNLDTKDIKNSSGSSTATRETPKWQFSENANQLLRLGSEQRNFSEQRSFGDQSSVVVRPNTSKLSLERNHQKTETERIIAEAKQDKQFLEEVHSAQRKVGDLQAHLKGLENKLAEKNICGSSFDSYNLNADGYPLRPMCFNNTSFKGSNASFNASSESHTPTLLDSSPTTSYPPTSSLTTNNNNYSPSLLNDVVNVVTTSSNYQNKSPNSSFNHQNSVNRKINVVGGNLVGSNYPPKSPSNFSTSFDANFSQISPNYKTSLSPYDYNTFDERLRKK